MQHQVLKHVPKRPEDRRQLNIRLTKKEYAKIIENAKRWADGNMSLWIRYAACDLSPRIRDIVDVG